MDIWQEWRAGTDPTNVLSVLRLLTPVSGGPGVIVSWQSVSGRNYFLERGADLGMQPPFLLLRSNLTGQTGIDDLHGHERRWPRPALLPRRRGGLTDEKAIG